MLKEECPTCKNSVDNQYLGTSRYYDNNFYIFLCKRCKDNKYFVKDKSTNKVISICDDTFKNYKDYMIVCPKKHEHYNLSKDKNHSCKYIYAKGNSLRFYCKNHPKRRKRTYHFKHKEKTKIITLQKFFKSISKPLYKKLSAIYKEGQYDKNNHEKIVSNLLKNKIQQSIIADIFHIDQSTISRLNKNINKGITEPCEIINETPYDFMFKIKYKDSMNRLFYTKIEINDRLLNNLKDRDDICI